MNKDQKMLGVFFCQVDIQQVVVYCDPSLAIQEACCEIPGARVSRSQMHTAVK